MENQANTPQATQAKQDDAVRVQCTVVSVGNGDVKTIKTTGRQYVWQQIQLSVPGSPLDGMVLPGSKTILSAEGVKTTVLPIGEACFAYLRSEISTKTGQPIVFANISTGVAGSEQKDVVAALLAHVNMNSAI